MVDANKRLSARQVLEHPWIVRMLGGKVQIDPSDDSGASKSAPALPNLAKARGNMKAFNARRKLKAAAMIARLRKLNSFASASDGSSPKGSNGAAPAAASAS